MAEINNALAAQIKVPEVDLGGTLAKIAQINSLNASTERTQQDIEHKKFLYNQGGGYDPSELQTLAATRQQHFENAGRIGSAYLANPNDRAWSAAVDEAERVGLIRGGSLEKAQYLSLPPAQRANVARSLQQAGMSSQTAVEQTGVPAGNAARESGYFTPYSVPPNEPVTNRTAAATGGRSIVPSSPAIVGDDEAVRKGLYNPTPEQIKRGVTGPTPNAEVANRFPNQSIFQPRIVRGPDGSISSSVTPETQGLQGSAVDRFKQIQETSARAQDMMPQLDAIEHDNEVLNTSGWSSTGAGANAKLSAAKSINSFFQSVGMQPPIDPEKVASWEGYNKQTFRAGADFARTLGGHQAESIIQGSISATPNVENTYFGSKIITNAIRQTAQRQVDMYRFTLDYGRHNGGSTFGAEDAFNQQFPPKLYSQTAVANAIPKASIDRLTASGGDAKNKAQFDSVFGPGMADFVLRNTNGRQ